MIENKAGLRIISPGERPPTSSVVLFKTKEQRAFDASNAMDPDIRARWMLFLQDINPQQADVMWRILWHETDDAIADALGISVDEVHGIIDQARSKIGGQISS